MENKWPKKLPVLSDEQIRIKKEFMQLWHEVLPKKFGIIEKFNHGFPAKFGKKSKTVLEIGSGLGEHIKYENLDGINYHAMEIIPKMAEVIRKTYPKVTVVMGDCQEKLPFTDKFFDKVLAIHVLEHLNNLPKTLEEIRRVLKPDGEFCVVIPCEGGLAYSLARKISAERVFKNHFKMSYDWLIKSEHINKPDEIVDELEKFFTIKKTKYFPLKIPSYNLNLVIGLILLPKK